MTEGLEDDDINDLILEGLGYSEEEIEVGRTTFVENDGTLTNINLKVETAWIGKLLSGTLKPILEWIRTEGVALVVNTVTKLIRVFG